ncbi:MAG: outer membrane lipid asymmetry maintenance protein MlaD [Pseudomonadota bacterium]|jgi:phospholipid/cholesterol/gamma-HCH transport system substrate-binding protein|nr:outer membrane lipid asymmetry maintenance protein MlaD [Rhodobiaceae bacterium]MEC9074722.1 outer membrane lipid asymmetry maintenance protein MlaD [Pseudomonadota bacterium]MEC9097847.1 outer membrane lipid asymmetry maintenance protein MlaD [Pseudomonadota bacterium]|tara:strand:- start:249 stop:695 length:447 start_codon:yes stop_codon:yes gene_type:complete
MRSNTFETFIGAIVIILAVSFLFYSFSITDNNSEGTYQIKATFNRIDGIQIGSDVRLSGIKIGSVAKSSLNQTTYEADLVLVIDDSIYIPDDSSAKITMDGLLGSNYISIEPGGSDIYLTENDYLLYTQGSIDLIGLVGEALFSVEEN